MSTSARRLLDDLLNVEVDVIVGDDIAPADAPTMATVIGCYERWLADRLPVIEARWSSYSPSDSDREAVEQAQEGAACVDTAPIDERIPGVAGAGGATALLRAAAAAEAKCRILDLSDPPPDSEWLPVLRRIRGNMELFATLPPDARTPSVEEVRIVRKAAELGTATISAQSVVQLDGDVLLRADGDSFLASERDALRTMHGRAIGAALAHWRVLVDFAGQITMAAAGLVAAIVRVVRNPVSAVRGWNMRRTLDLEASGTPLRELVGRQQLRDTWREFGRIRRELLDDGGITVDSPAATGDEPPPPPYARTVIQPDGDALWFVRTDVTNDLDLLDAHVARVAAEYRARGAVVATLQRYLVAVQALVSAVVGVIGAILAIALADGFATLLGLVLTAVGSTGFVAMVRSAIGWVLRRGLRSGMP